MLTSMSVVRGKGVMSVVLEELSRRRSMAGMRVDIVARGDGPLGLHPSGRESILESNEVAWRHWHAAASY